jgi:hypothetical protein
VLCRTAADLLVGPTKSTRSRSAWRQAYRAVEHRFSKQACKNKGIVQLFPDAIQDFADTYVTMQTKRHDCDYDPYITLTKSEVKADIAIVRQAIDAFGSTAKKDRRAFAAYVILKQRE